MTARQGKGGGPGTVPGSAPAGFNRTDKVTLMKELYLLFRLMAPLAAIVNILTDYFRSR